MTISLITLTHNRKETFIKNYKKNLKKISSILKHNPFKINHIINCDDGSITEDDLRKINKKIPNYSFYFYTYDYFFPIRYFDLMIKIKSDLIWCIEDDDIILNFPKISSNEYNYFGYYKSDLSKINNYNEQFFKNKKINYKTLQLSQMLFKYIDLKHFLLLNKKLIKNKNYINHDELIINWILKNKKIKILKEKIFYQTVKNKDNMSFNDLKEWF